MSYALLGTIAFDLLNAPKALDETRSAVFAEHEVLSGKPKLQAMGLALTEIRLQISLHHQIGNVEERYAALVQAKEAQEALAFVLGFTQYKGNFVITEISSNTIFTDEQGNALARDVQLTLREFVGNVQEGLLGLALQRSANSLLGSILPVGAMNLFNTAKRLVQKGLQIYNKVKRAITDIRNAVTAVKNAMDSPASMLAALAGNLGGFLGALGSLSELVGLGDSFNTLLKGVDGVADFVRDTAQLTQTMTNLYDLLTNDFDEVKAWGLAVESQFDEITETQERLAESSAKMTAWLAVRADFPELGEEMAE